MCSDVTGGLLIYWDDLDPLAVSEHICCCMVGFY